MTQLTHLTRRIAALAVQLETGLVERRLAVRLVLLAALAGEHSLLIGPPGTAKSALARRLHAAFSGARYFERLLTRFSVPEELFGPLSISALEQDRYERHVEGFLPDASIAFIDEVFKANSAILNALLTLLNEREFDNGAGRIRCPLISVVGATNEVPDDEVAEAFFDRFLLRLPVAPVSDAGFARLLALEGETLPALDDALRGEDLAALERAAVGVTLDGEVIGLLGELRVWLNQGGHYVSDRRWVKIAGLLRTAAATEGRVTVAVWDLCLLPWCLGAEADVQRAVGEWLANRLGVSGRLSPERIGRVVEAFEAQLEAERQANDLDYDAEGRLRFSATELAGEIGDAKGGAGALRLTHSRKRRYGACHIAARLAQIDDALARIAAYAEEVAAYRADFRRHAAQAIWLDEVLAADIDTRLAETAEGVASLHARLAAARAGFERLPRLDADPGVVPEPVVCDALDA